MNESNRKHFIIDINSILNLFGSQFFLIFYFGRHLHPRQQETLINQRVWTNRLIGLIIVMMLVGFGYGLSELISWRLSQG